MIMLSASVENANFDDRGVHQFDYTGANSYLNTCFCIERILTQV